MSLDVDERDFHILLLSCTTKLSCCDGGLAIFISNNHLNPENNFYKQNLGEGELFGVATPHVEKMGYSINSSLLQRSSSHLCACFGSSGPHIVRKL